MYSFRELSKAAKLFVDAKEVRLAVLGNCATQFFSVAIQGYAKLSGLNLRVYDADYNQIEAQLLDPESEVYEFHPNGVVLWISTEKLYEEFLDLCVSERRFFAETYVHKIETYWNLIVQNHIAYILQPNFTEINDKVLGNYSCKIETAFIYQIRKLNYLLEQAMIQRGEIYPVDLLAIQIQLGVKRFYKAATYYNSKMPVAVEAYPYVAKAVVDILKVLDGQTKKCVICDLDNTLWGGVIGDDGMGGIEIGEFGKGHAFSNLQRWLKQLKEYGIILAVCSKNDEETAKEPFIKHEEMVLRLPDISIFVANWNDKASNIRVIQESLNIGMDSIIFLDDNPFERNLVRRELPEVEVPELPEDPALYLEYLQKCNYFETISYTGGDQDRTKLYQAEFERRKQRQDFSSIDEYLKSLKMCGNVKHFEEIKYARIAQLTQRTNQFNLRTIRYTESEIKKIAEDNTYIALYFTLSDKLGDYGVISVVIMKKEGDRDAFIDTWLMSCRVLKRGMEEYVMNHVIEEAKNQGIIRLKAEYIPTAKNRMVCNIYRDMGFEETGSNTYDLKVKDYVRKVTYIGEKENNG